MKILRVVLVSCVAIASLSVPAVAHGGGLNREGCHNQRSNGTYHCHRSGGASTNARAPQASGGAFANCTAARAAGYTNIRRGGAGYGSHLDRDNDGIACET